MIKCKNCGTELPDNIKFCTKCGNPISSGNNPTNESQTKTCPTCGTVCAATMRFCQKCGTDLTSGQFQTPPPYTQQQYDKNTAVSPTPIQQQAMSGSGSSYYANGQRHDSKSDNKKIIIAIIVCIILAAGGGFFCWHRGMFNKTSDNNAVVKQNSEVSSTDSKSATEPPSTDEQSVTADNTDNGEEAATDEGDAENIIDSVKSGTFNDYPDKTVEEAFSDFFSEPEWDSAKENGNNYVIFTGNCTYDGKPASAKFVFLVNDSGFQVHSCKIGNHAVTTTTDLDSVLNTIFGK